MTEQSESYKVPKAEEVEALLRGDFGKDTEIEATLELENGEAVIVHYKDGQATISSETPGENSEVMEVGDRQDEWMSAEQMKALLRKLSGEKSSVLETSTGATSNSKVMEVSDRETKIAEEIRQLLNCLSQPSQEKLLKELRLETPPGENSEVMEVGDRIRSVTQVDSSAEPMCWDEALSEMAEKFFGVDVSTQLTYEIFEYFQRCGVIDEDGDCVSDLYRERILELRKAHAHQLNEVGELIARLYLDFYHIEQVASSLMQVCDRYPPDNLKAIASLITQQCMGSRTNIASHSETDHYPSSLISRQNREVNNG